MARGSARAEGEVSPPSFIEIFYQMIKPEIEISPIEKRRGVGVPVCLLGKSLFILA
jgi:hypothetical protein